MATKETTITFRLSQEQKEIIKQLAADKDQTVSKYIYNIVVGHLKEKENG